MADYPEMYTQPGVVDVAAGMPSSQMQRQRFDELPAAMPTNTIAVPGFGPGSTSYTAGAAPTIGQEAPGALPGELESITQQIAAEGLSGNKEMYHTLIMQAINKLRSQHLPETPPELEEMGMMLDEQGRPVPLRDYASKAAHRARETADRISAAIEKFQNEEEPKLAETEMRAAQDFEDASIEARYNMPAEDIKALKATIAAASAAPDDFNIQQKAQSALAVLARAEQEAVEPLKHNIWADKSKFQSAMFIALNAMAGAMKAYGYEGPTPMDVAEKLMDEDIERQKQLAKNRDMKIDRARNAFEIASRRTQNAAQAELMARNLMWAPIEAEAKAVGMFDAVAEIADRRLKAQMDYRTTAHSQERMQDATALSALIQMYLQQERLESTSGRWRGKMRLLSDATGTLNAVRNLRRFQQLWRESHVLAAGFLLGKTPANITDAGIYEALRGSFALEIAAAKNRGRPTEPDRQAVMKAIPGAGSLGSGGEKVWDYIIEEAMRKAEADMAAVGAAAGDEAVNDLIRRLEEGNPNVQRYIGSIISDAPGANNPAAGFVEE